MELRPMETPPILGQLAPGFTLPDLSGARHSLQDYRGRNVILNFWSAECPWSKRVDEELTRLLPGWGQAVFLLTIASNANEPPDLLQRIALARGLAPILLDAGHRIADLYSAQTTPHLLVIDPEGMMRYQGAFDNVSFRRRTPTQAYLKDAIEALLAGRLPNPAEVSPYGCTIVRYIA